MEMGTGVLAEDDFPDWGMGTGLSAEDGFLGKYIGTGLLTDLSDLVM